MAKVIIIVYNSYNNTQIVILQKDYVILRLPVDSTKLKKIIEYLAVRIFCINFAPSLG